MAIYYPRSRLRRRDIDTFFDTFLGAFWFVSSPSRGVPDHGTPTTSSPGALGKPTEVWKYRWGRHDIMACVCRPHAVCIVDAACVLLCLKCLWRAQLYGT